MQSPHLAPSRGGRQVRVPAPRRRCREGARPRARADLGSSVPGATPLAPRDRTPARHFGVSRCGPGAHRKRKDGFRGLRYSHAHHRPHPPPQPAYSRPRESVSVPQVCPILGSAPDADKKHSSGHRVSGSRESQRRREGGCLLRASSISDPAAPPPAPDLPRVLRPDYC